MATSIPRHAALDDPKTVFEHTVAALDERLSELRKQQDEDEAPANWLTPADEKDIQAITKRWKNLPKNYLDFLTRFSPLNVSIPEEDEPFAREIVLLGASELIDGQVGYAVDSRTGRPDKAWPGQYLVIAHVGRDPFALDLSQTKGADAPVAFAPHGQGRWDLLPIASSFQEFLEALTEGEPTVEDPKEEIQRLTRKIRKTPDRPRLYVKRGECLVYVGQYKRALKDFDKAIELGGNSSDVFEGRGNAWFGLEEIEKAIDDYTRAIKRQPTVEAYCNRGRAHASLGQSGKAIADLTKALELDPEDADARFYRGEAYRDRMDLARAEADFSQAIEFSDGEEDWLDECYLYRGGIHCDTNRTDEALADLNRSLELDPRSACALVFRANTYCRMKDYRKALADYEKAVRLDADYDYALAALAYLLATCPTASIRDGKRALRLAERAVKLTKGKENLDSLAAAQAEIGKHDEAVKTQMKAIKLCENRTELPKLKEQLAAYRAGMPYRDME